MTNYTDTLSPAVPELQVPDVPAAQAWYRDALGFEVAWYKEDGGIGAVTRGDCTLFLRGGAQEASSAALWIFVEEIDGFYASLSGTDVSIAMPLQNTPWGLQQFTITDPFGTTLHFHYDL